VGGEHDIAQNSHAPIKMAILQNGYPRTIDSVKSNGCVTKRTAAIVKTQRFRIKRMTKSFKRIAKDW
jgi:hypothetical protein